MQIVRMLISLVVAIIVLTGVILGVMIYLAPPIEIPKELSALQQALDSLNTVSKIDSSQYNRVIGLYDIQKDSLERTLDRYVENELKMKFAYDSLDQLVSSLKATIKQKDSELEKLTASLTTTEDKETKAKEVAKTFGSMDPKQMAPILSNLDNADIISIYKQMNSRTKKNILLALPRERAAKITQKILD